jgi:hypothetical protein
MSQLCEKDQCSSCLWKPYHSCIYDTTQDQCEVSPDKHWCGATGHKAKVNASPPMRANTTSCGTCNGCLLTSDPTTGCYTQWGKTTCDNAGTGYKWCGSDTPYPPINCCDFTNGSCSKVTTGSCPASTSKVDSCTSSSCYAAPQCVNPYYSGSSASNNIQCGLSSILSGNNDGVTKWLQIFPSLNPSSDVYKALGCNAPSPGSGPTGGRPTWGAGCFMYIQGGMNGLTAFLTAASKFTAFANSSDARKNIIELASFLGNVTQETGSPGQGGLVYAAELSSCQNSLFGKGPIQLTGSINYQMATLGLNKPSDFNSNLTMSGVLTGNCNTTNALDPRALDSCWSQCAAATPAAPPHGAGYNYCAKPWLASGYNDLTSPAKLDPLPAWSSALWYWMNAPLGGTSASYYAVPGDVSCATAHNLIQDPQYNCGDWCPILAIAQVGCASCCTSKVDPTKLDPQTINRIGNFVKIAGILGLPEAQGYTAANALFCSLLNTCASGGGSIGSSTCPSNLSYQCFLDNICNKSGGGGGGTPTQQLPVCGKVTHATPAPVCNVITGNNSGAAAADCTKCQNGYQDWPCQTAGACQWAV